MAMPPGPPSEPNASIDPTNGRPATDYVHIANEALALGDAIERQQEFGEVGVAHYESRVLGHTSVVQGYYPPNCNDMNSHFHYALPQPFPGAQYGVPYYAYNASFINPGQHAYAAGAILHPMQMTAPIANHNPFIPIKPKAKTARTPAKPKAKKKAPEDADDPEKVYACRCATGTCGSRLCGCFRRGTPCTPLCHKVQSGKHDHSRCLWKGQWVKPGELPPLEGAQGTQGAQGAPLKDDHVASG